MFKRGLEDRLNDETLRHEKEHKGKKEKENPTVMRTSQQKQMKSRVCF